MVKKVISIVVVLVMALAMLTACTDSEMQKRVDELEANAQKQADRIQELEEDLQSKSDKIKGLEEDLQNKSDKIKDLESNVKNKADRIEELEKDSKTKSDKIKDLEKRNKEMEEEIAELEDKVIELGGEIEIESKGAFYNLEDAYKQGWLTREDIMNISYFRQGCVYKGTRGQRVEEWEIINFTPTIDKPVLSKKLERDIQNAFYLKYKLDYEDTYKPDGTKYEPKDITIIKYCGNYNGIYVVSIDDSAIGVYGASTVERFFDDLALAEPVPPLRVFKYN